MKRFSPSGGAIAAQNAYSNNLRIINANRPVGQQSPLDFATPQESNLSVTCGNLISLIGAYLGIPRSQNPRRAQLGQYDQMILDLSDYGRDVLRISFGIFDEAPTAFNAYLPTFVVYDFLNIQANTVASISVKETFLRMAGMIRKILPTMDADHFSKWEEYYRDFKNGKYSGGRNRWLARKAAETPYDPVDPVFNFSNPPTVRIPGVSRSNMATTNAMYYLDVMPPTQRTLNNGLTNIIKGGRSRRAARSSRRRF